MKREEVLSTKCIRWLELHNEVLYEYVLPRIEEMPSEISHVLLDRLEAAFQARLSAGYSGEKHDGGASKITDAIEMFVHGWYKKLPREWNSISKRLKRMSDPEWPEYQRLKKKFEGGGK